MILIDFQGGTHGNFLESVLNGIHVGERLDAFNHLGASHIKPYDPTNMLFFASHHSWSLLPDYPTEHYSAVILITVDVTDLPRLQLVRWLRGSDANIDVESVNTLENILKIKDSPDIDDDDYPAHSAQAHIRNTLMAWSETKDGKIEFNVVREMLKFSFNPESSGFARNQVEAEAESISKFPANFKIIKFPFSAFYDWDTFSTTLKNTLLLLDLDNAIPDFVYDQHKKFLSQNRAAGITDLPIYYFTKLINGEDVLIEGMSVYQEAYLDYLYETHYGVKALFYHNNSKYFRSTGEILLYIEQRKLAETKA